MYAAGLMGILGEDYDVNNVSVYTAYLNDRISYVPEDPVDVRLGLITNNVIQNEWKEEKILIDSILGGTVNHDKILLSEDDGVRGMIGEYTLSV